jgi:hypothetical protein
VAHTIGVPVLTYVFLLVAISVTVFVVGLVVFVVSRVLGG